MTSTARNEVKIGDRTEAIARFTGFKVARASRLLGEIGTAYPEIMEEVHAFTRKYESENAVEITPGIAKLKGIQLRDRDFGESGKIIVPEPPSTQEQIFAVLPKIVEVAEAPIAQLLALMIAPNSELEEHDEAGTVDDYLAKAGKRLLHRAEFDQLLELAAVSAGVLMQQFAERIDEAGNLFGLLGIDLPTRSPKIENDENAQPSSTDSQTPTDGLGAKSSIGSNGEN